MTTTAEPITATRSRGGRPRDPSRGPVIIDAVIDVLAAAGLQDLTADAVAAEAGVGKATIYRRWPSFDTLLADAVLTLGVRPHDVDFGRGTVGTLRGDVTALVTAATQGTRATAERAILSALPRRPDLRAAYLAGPAALLEDRLDAVMDRAVARGDAIDWPGNERIHAAIALVHVKALTSNIEHNRVESVMRQTGMFT